MNKLILEKGNIFDGCRFIGSGDILIEEGKIVNIADQISSDCRRIDVQDMYVCPGFIDIHIHGACGCDFTDAERDHLKKICRYLALHGITSIVATALTAGNEKIRSCLQNIKEYNSKKRAGAKILGVHLEGPFINEKRKGGLNEKYIQEPTLENYKNLVEGYEEIIKTVTLAPEIPGARELIRYLREKGKYVSIGHSEASYDEIVEAVNLGANRATHIFNGMSALNHREPGTAGGLLERKEVYAEIIADLIHLHPAVIRLIFNAKGSGRCITISDAIEATGLEDGEYNIGGKEVTVSEGIGRLKESLILCGCTTMLDQSVKNLVAIGIDLDDVLKSVTSNPATALGFNGRKGEIKSGCDADIVVLDDNLDVIFTVINGEVIEK